MDVNFLQIALVFLVTFVAAIDQFDFTESLYQPIVTGPIIGAILGDVQTGLVVGGTYQLMTIGNMPIGGAQPRTLLLDALWRRLCLHPRHGSQRRRCDRDSVRPARPVRCDPVLHPSCPDDGVLPRRGCEG